MLDGVGQPLLQIPSNSIEVSVDGKMSAWRSDNPLARNQGLIGERKRRGNRDREIACQVDGDRNLLDAGQGDTACKPSCPPLEAAHDMPREDVVEVLLGDAEHERGSSSGDCAH